MARKLLSNILDGFDRASAEENAADGNSILEMQLYIKQLEASVSSVYLDVSTISRSPYQPRRHFNLARQADLNASVKLHGVTQNIIVRERADGGYELIAGERRLIAAKACNHLTIPAKILNLSDCDARSLALAENLQRENLNVYEETLAVVGLIGALLGIESIEETKALIFSFYNAIRRCERSGDNVISTDLTRQVVEQVLSDNLKGMSVQSFAKNRLPLLDLSDDIITAIENGMPYTKALIIARVENFDDRADLIKTVDDENFSLLEVKKEVNRLIKSLELSDPVVLESNHFEVSLDPVVLELNDPEVSSDPVAVELNDPEANIDRVVLELNELEVSSDLVVSEFNDSEASFDRTVFELNDFEVIVAPVVVDLANSEVIPNLVVTSNSVVVELAKPEVSIDPTVLELANSESNPDLIVLELNDSEVSTDLTIQKTRLTSILRQLESMKKFDRLQELNELLDRIEALMS